MIDKLESGVCFELFFTPLKFVIIVTIILIIYMFFHNIFP